MTDRAASRTGDGETELEVPLETVCFIIIKAREFDAKDPVTEPSPASYSCTEYDGEHL